MKSFFKKSFHWICYIAKFGCYFWMIAALVGSITKLTPKKYCFPNLHRKPGAWPNSTITNKPLVPNWSVTAAYLGDRVASVKRAAVPEMCLILVGARGSGWARGCLFSAVQLSTGEEAARACGDIPAHLVTHPSACSPLYPYASPSCFTRRPPACPPARRPG